jgi:hypothetical protein
MTIRRGPLVAGRSAVGWSAVGRSGCRYRAGCQACCPPSRAPRSSCPAAGASRPARSWAAHVPVPPARGVPVRPAPGANVSVVDQRVRAARRAGRADPARAGGAGRPIREPDRDPGGCSGRLAACPSGSRTDPAGRQSADRDPVFGFNPAARAERLDRAFTVTDPATVARIAAVVNGLTRFPGGAFSCPAESGGQMRLTFFTRPVARWWPG